MFLVESVHFKGTRETLTLDQMEAQVSLVKKKKLVKVPLKVQPKHDFTFLNGKENHFSPRSCQTCRPQELVVCTNLCIGMGHMHKGRSCSRDVLL